MASVGEVVGALEALYPPSLAESWDRIGLVCGDPDDECRRVLLAVDPASEVADEALAWDADLVLSHHPLLLRGVHSVAATTPKGRTIHRLVRGGCALFTAHTNADAPQHGVNDALAAAVGLTEWEALDPVPGPALDKLTVYVPAGDADALRTALAEAGAGAIGDYDTCSFSSVGEGRFRPRDGATPTIGQVGDLETVEEVRVEVVLPRRRRDAVVAALWAAHPYEEPAYDVVELADVASRSGAGLGRIGDLAEPVTLREFATRVAAALPATARGATVGGDPDRIVRRVALCSGAGDSYLDAVRRTGADVYLTSDLRHHPAAEFLEHGGAALVDVPHWAAEWTWLPVAERLLRDAFGESVETRVSTLNTDPWTFRVDSPGRGAADPDPRQTPRETP